MGGAPTDEYESEASLIEGRIAKLADLGKSSDAGQVETIIAEVWNSQFGPFRSDELNKRLPAFSSVARKLTSEL
jgi:hypothetical protein